MSDDQLKQSFDYCKSHNDPGAWLALAIAYAERGYLLNASYCLRRAEEVRVTA